MAVNNNNAIYDIFRNTSLGGGIGSIFGGLGGLFGGNKSNPANAANKYLEKIPGAVSPYYNPYIQSGQASGKNLQSVYGDLLNNPGNIYNKLGEGYKESPGYQSKLKAGLQAAGNAAAAGGTLGTPLHQQTANQVANDIASQDFEEYLNHIIGLYGTGISGNENQVNRGFEASKGLSDILGNVLGQQGQYAYAGEAGKNAGRGQSISDILAGLTQVAPWLFQGTGSKLLQG